MRNLILSIFCILSTVSCVDKQPVPKNVLPEEKMKAVMWDIARAQMVAQQVVASDSSINVVDATKKLTDEVFKIHHVTKKDFDKSYNWYLKNPQILNRLLDSLYTQKSRAEMPALKRPELKKENK